MSVDVEQAVFEFMNKQKQSRGFIVERDGVIESSIPDDVKILRMRLMTEELAETIVAMHEKDIPGVADGLADLVYVVVGTAIAYGIPFNKIFADVQRANMTKSALSSNQKGGKVQKDGFFPPRTIEILREWIS